MRFMLMMHAPRGTGDYQVGSWSSAALKAHMDFMHQLNQDLSAAGELVGGEGLAPPGEARVVRAGQGSGAPAVTDGPYLEAKEYLAGYCLLECETEERALEIAARWPDARLNAVELRPIMDDSGMEM